MEKNIILFFGNVQDGEYEGLLTEETQLGIIIDSKNKAKLADLSKFKYAYEYDFSLEKSQIIAGILTLKKLSQNLKIICLREKYLYLYQEICYQTGLVSTSFKSICLARNKYEMKKAFLKKIPAKYLPDFSFIQEESCLEKFIASNKKYIIKPINLQNNNFVISCDSKDWKGKFKQLKEIALKQQIDTFWVEEDIPGSVHSIDCLVNQSGEVIPTPVIDILTAQDIGMNDFHHFAMVAPSKLSSKLIFELQNLAIAAVTAMQCTSCIAHVKFIVRGNDVKLLEVIPMVGRNRIQMIEKGYGGNILKQFVNFLDGVNECYYQPKPFFAIVTPFPAQKMLFNKLFNMHQLQKISSLKSWVNFATPNETIGPAKLGYNNFFLITLQANERDQLMQDINKISQINFYQDNFKESQSCQAINF